MAIRYAVANGFADVAATWDGGTLPASTDDLYANNFTVSIRANLTANSIKKIANASPVIAGGGSFVITAAATVTITAGIASTDNATNSTNLLLVNAGSANVTLAGGTITGGSSTSRVAVAVDATYTGTLTVQNNLVGGPAGSNAHALSVGGGSVIINGTCSGAASGSTSGSGVSVSGATAIVTINGAVNGSAVNSGNSWGVVISNATAQLTLLGTLTGGAAGSAACRITSGLVRVDALLIYGPSAPIEASGGSIMFKRTGTSLGMKAPSDDNWPVATGADIIVERYTTGNPLPANVRSGTTYGPGATSTGTLAVPPASSVAAGVPVDNTVGSAALKLSDVLSGTGAQIAAATSG